MHFSFTLLSTLFLAAGHAWAHIYGLSPYTATYHPTPTSTFPLTFLTENGPTFAADFSVVIGLYPTSESSIGGGNALVDYIQNIDLVATGHSSTGTGSFTINIPLPSSYFFSGSGNYVIKAIVTQAFGAAETAQLAPFTITIAVAL
ncbi:hypothetical protein SISSUDRAFT_1059089 [Sistotremastrum suecicum HHB10207 ss-3]|uniref:Uncharacterized protein n=1 Tax=Sistotremastrum suecicum HHB10207 ss-3 TaxID=1314776 RepID=A0A166GKM3_9AGAM|nr:hypothetical protein SISSUDRAFT_1059089 [Sistotremastrum suecicum HHB10207 ss-3]